MSAYVWISYIIDKYCSLSIYFNTVQIQMINADVYDV